MAYTKSSLSLALPNKVQLLQEALDDLLDWDTNNRDKIKAEVEKVSYSKNWKKKLPPHDMQIGRFYSKNLYSQDSIGNGVGMVCKDYTAPCHYTDKDTGDKLYTPSVPF